MAKAVGACLAHPGLSPWTLGAQVAPSIKNALGASVPMGLVFLINNHNNSINSLRSNKNYKKVIGPPSDEYKHYREPPSSPLPPSPEPGSLS
jgi:hypothetical protein